MKAFQDLAVLIDSSALHLPGRRSPLNMLKLPDMDSAYHNLNNLESS